MKKFNQPFDLKLASLLPSEIVQAMVNGLNKKWVQVDMESFGGYNGVCYGCAATNTICDISGKAFSEYDIEAISLRSKGVLASYDVLWRFEYAIDQLRKGNIYGYNLCTKDGDNVMFRSLPVFITSDSNNAPDIDSSDLYRLERLETEDYFLYIDRYQHFADYLCLCEVANMPY